MLIFEIGVKNIAKNKIQILDLYEQRKIEKSWMTNKSKLALF